MQSKKMDKTIRNDDDDEFVGEQETAVKKKEKFEMKSKTNEKKNWKKIRKLIRTIYATHVELLSIIDI